MRDSQYFIYTSTNSQQLHVHDVQANKSQRNTVGKYYSLGRRRQISRKAFAKSPHQTPKAAINDDNNFKDFQIWQFENRNDNLDFESTN